MSKKFYECYAYYNIDVKWALRYVKYVLIIDHNISIWIGCFEFRESYPCTFQWQIIWFIEIFDSGMLCQLECLKKSTNYSDQKRKPESFKDKEMCAMRINVKEDEKWNWFNLYV